MKGAARGPLAAAIQTWADRQPDEPAVISAQGVHSWRELAEEARRMAAELAPRERLMVLLPELGSALSAVLACALAGVDVVLLPALQGEAMARARLAECHAHRLVTVAPGRWVPLEARDPGETSPPSMDPAVLLFSSGTTGVARCVRHRWETLIAGVRQHDRYRGARWLLGYPLASFSGLQVLLHCLLNGSTTVIPSGFGPEAGMRALTTTGAGYLSCTATYLRRLLLSAPPAAWAEVSLRQVTLGGEIADQAVLDAIARAVPGIRTTHIYASTEVGVVLSVSDGRAGFDAALLDGQRLRVSDGELWVRRGRGTMHGYLGAPDFGDEWLRTGDRVHVEGDRVYFLGRGDRVINVGGFKVDPGQVEAVIRGLDGILGARVTGHRSSIMGNLLKARVFVPPGTDESEVREAVRARCAAQLPPHMVPRLFEFSSELPLTPTQKLAEWEP